MYDINVQIARGIIVYILMNVQSTYILRLLNLDSII